MTVTIELPPDIEMGLLAKAAEQGLALPQYLALLLREQIPVRASAGLSPLERAAAWRESVKGLPRTEPLSDNAVSRESIYSARG